METLNNDEVIQTVNMLFPNYLEKNPMINLGDYPDVVNALLAESLTVRLKNCSVDQVTFFNASDDVRSLFTRAHLNNNAKFSLRFM